MSEFIYSDREWEGIKEGIGKIESDNRYDIQERSGLRYYGRWQMGEQAISETAKHLGMVTPTSEEFRNNPRLQDKLFRGYFEIGNTYMDNNSPAYKAMSLEDKKKTLPMLQLGAGNLIKFLEKGIVFEDKNKTPITKFRDSFKDFKWDNAE